MRKFARVLKPGGHVAFTTRHESFPDYCAWGATQVESSDSYLRALGALFPDIETARAAYRAGTLVHATSLGVSGGGPRTEEFYGETFIPKEWAEKELSEDFSLIFDSFDSARYDQICFVLRRK